MPNDLVAYSRAGDVFHYRWAARRCLHLIYPNTTLETIVIEGSKEEAKAGEYVIDVSEYSKPLNGKQNINYYQLKHTTVQQNEPFSISDLKDTFEGFAKRFVQHVTNGNSSDVCFTIVTNRKFEISFKQNIATIAKGEKVDKRFQETIEKYTNLQATELSSFCKILKLEDSEGDYQIQEKELRLELSRLMASPVDEAVVNNIVELVQRKVLPSSDGKILKEEVLHRFQITSEKQLYPAPAIWDAIDNVVDRKQYTVLKDCILNSSHPVIVHAAGGVGKSVFCRQIINSLPEKSIGIAYDCFGAGKYRNPSEPRHGHRQALIQIANELASKGLCAPLIIGDSTREENITTTFLHRLKDVLESLRKAEINANLVILIDAVDNAEMAANELGQRCFAHELLHEEIPAGCKLVFLCRTERINLLKPQSFITKLELKPFSEIESRKNLKSWFEQATKYDASEFHRLTSGNPRVQANALNNKYATVDLLLQSLGPSGTSVDKQIELQLEKAVSKIKDRLPDEYQKEIDTICLGLSSLPPHIPIDILSKAAGVDNETIRSFVTDIGRALWLTETSVQFRDEPTESWFRKTFLANSSNFKDYIDKLEPLANQFSYVAEVLPQLYLQAEQYQKLIETALSDNFLPENNPIDARTIRVYRLQFAFKAALKAKQYGDAIKLAMRAGEEVAGNRRQLSLLQSNIDLLTLLQSQEKVEEIAFKQSLRSLWSGSENIYSASLLSGIKDYHGEARGYLRAANNWLHIQFEEQKKRKDLHHEDKITNRDILEIAYALLNIHGVKACLAFLLRLQPQEVVFNVMQSLARRLIDIGRFDEINELLANCTNQPYFTVAVVDELMDIGKFPEKKYIRRCLLLLSYPNKKRIAKQNDIFDNSIHSAIVSFIEACLHCNLTLKQILDVLEYYIPIKATRSVYSSHQSSGRNLYLKALAVRILLAGKTEVNIEEILPDELVAKEKNNNHRNDLSEFTEIIYGLFPWFFLRAQIISNNEFKLLDNINKVNETSKKARTNRYRNYDTLPNEIAEICFSILAISVLNQEEVVKYYNEYLKDDKAFNLIVRLNAVRTAYRAHHLIPIRQDIELSTFNIVKNYKTSEPDDAADKYISLARAVIVDSIPDSSEYFNEAVKIVSKFGDELVQRWEAIVSLAKEACVDSNTSDELAYRFVRCAELVGENVGREKYWNRSEAIELCTRMSAGIGISALSRWRDRDVGRFEYQLEALLHELTNSKLVSPLTGWALTRFFSYHNLIEYLSICFQVENNSEVKQTILADSVHLLQVEGANKEYWKKLKEIADIFQLNNESLNSIVHFYSEQNNPETHTTIGEPAKIKRIDLPESKWDIIFQNLSTSTPDGFSKIIERFKSKSNDEEHRLGIRELLKEGLARTEEKCLWDYLNNLLNSEYIDNYDVQDTLRSIQEEWTKKVSFKGRWNNFIYNFGKRYAEDLTNEYAFNSFIKEFKCDAFSINKLKEGVLVGLADSFEFANAEVFFGFVKLAINFAEANTANNLLDYAISRFELHLDNDFGDGPWSEWLHVSKDNNKNVAGFIWSSLGSPRSAMRWRAAHCIRVLADFGCTEVLDSLMEWLACNRVDAFGSKEFPFYNLHARQYLFIALARVVLDKPAVLYKYSEAFPKYALEEPHALIQKFASDIIISIEKLFPDSYTSDVLKSVNSVGKSELPVKEEDYNYITDSYWHKNELIDTNIDFHFAYDFDRYWFEPLADVFGLSEKQVEELAANIIVKEWKLGDKNGYNNDPRVILWNSSSSERETWHDHGSYPKTDNLDFYLSYHSMLVIAARLIKTMPVIAKRNYEDSNAWEYWLSRHLLTRDDGKWLADVKDPVPLKRPDWTSKEPEKEWKENIEESDFVECLKVEKNLEPWMYVKGGWHEKQSSNIEKFFVSTALVSKKTSDALLRALTTCINPHDYKLPYYEEHDMEIDSENFNLKGWIIERQNSKELDEFDPYADNAQYPLYFLGDSISERLNLKVDNDGRNWSFANCSELVLICESWSTHREEREEEPDQSGLRLKASLSFLRLLCTTFDCEIIFEVSITRDVTYRYRSYNEKREYAKPQHKIFILSADGTLRTTDKSYQLG